MIKVKLNYFFVLNQFDFRHFLIGGLEMVAIEAPRTFFCTFSVENVEILTLCIKHQLKYFKNASQTVKRPFLSDVV